MIQVVLIRSHWSFDQRCLGWGHNLRKGDRPCAMWSSEDMLREDGQTISLHSFILFPMTPNANPGLSMGHFGIVWATCMIPKCHHYKIPNLDTIKWLASTHQPNMKLVIGLNSQLSRQFQPKRMAGAGSIVNFMVGWKVEASHFIVVALGNHTSSPHYSKMAHWKARVGIGRHWEQNEGMQRDGLPIFPEHGTWESYK